MEKTHLSTALAVTVLSGAALCLLADPTEMPEGLEDLTSPSGTVTTTSSGSWVKPAKNAFDNGTKHNNDDRTIIQNTASADWTYDFGTPTVVNAYRLWSPSSTPYFYDKRMPKNWTFAGKNDGDADWTLLDEQTDQTGWGALEGRYYEFVNETPFRYYRFLSTAANPGSDGYTQFDELEYFYHPTLQPHFGNCVISKVADGEFRLTGVISAHSANALKIVFSAPDAQDVEINIGAQAEAVPFEKTISVTDGFREDVFYTAKLVAVNDEGTGTLDLPGLYYFGDALDPLDFTRKIEFTLSSDVQSALGGNRLLDFPVLIRFPGQIDGFDYTAFQTAGRDMMFADENGNEFPYEIDTWNPQGESLVWVKVPALTASMKIICYYGGAVNVLNDPTLVWSDYLGVWHFNGQTDGVTPNATANEGLDGASGEFTVIDGPFGSAAAQPGQNIRVADYEPAYEVGKNFSASGWFRLPGQTTSNYSTFISKKVGLNWDANTGWYLEMSQSKTKMTLIPSSGSTKNFLDVPDVTANWNHFYVTYNGSTAYVYLNGNTTPVISSTTAINASSTVFQMLASGQQGDEFRLSKTDASSLRVSMEYKTMAEQGFLVASASEPLDPAMPSIVASSLERTASGELTLGFTVKKVASSVTAVFSSEGNADIELPLGNFAVNGSFLQTYAFGGDLPVGRLYTVKLVATNLDNAEKVLEFTLPKSVYYGGSATISDYAKHVTITLPETFQGELSNFPLLVRVSESAISGFSSGDVKQAGKDVVFTDANGTQIPCECEVWNPAGESLFWVQVPSARAGTQIVMYYGTPAPIVAGPAMWSDYAGVWHLDETVAGEVAIIDATANGTNGKGGTKSTVTASGMFCGARGIPANQANGVAVISKNAAMDALTPSFTVSGWVRPYSLSSNWRYLFSRKSSDAYPSWGVQPRGDGAGNMSSLAAYSNGTSDSDSQRTLFTTSGKFTANAWTKYTFVYTPTNITLYLDGVPVATNATKPGAAVNGDLDFTIGGLTATSNTSLGADQDEVRLCKNPVSAEWVADEYAQETGAMALEFGAIEAADPTAPSLEAPVLIRNGDGSFSYSVRLLKGEGTVYAEYFDGENTVLHELSTADANYPKTYAETVAGLTAGTTYTYAVYSENTNGSKSRVAGGIFHNGTISMVKVSDAAEREFVPGIVTVSRENPGLAFTMTYQIDGTATSGVVYEPLTGSVTIPEGANVATIAIVPLASPTVKVDTDVVLTLDSGLYAIAPNAGSATVVIADLPPEEGFVTWVAPADGKASNPANWSTGLVPDDTANVLFDGRFSNAACEWDNAAPCTVASWTQRSDYTGTVTVDTTFDSYNAAFTNLTVIGDVKIDGGKLAPMTHGTSTATQFRLMMTVGGDFTVGPAGQVYAAGLGRWMNHSLWSGSSAHGGDNAQGTTQLFNPADPAFGSILEPTTVAHGCDGGTDQDAKKTRGGGAIYLVVTGDFVNNGVVNADGGVQYQASAAGGSIYIRAANITGSGTFTAKSLASGKTDGTGSIGSGGRIALVADGENTVTLSQITCSGRLEGWGRRGAPGTVYRKSATEAVISVRGDNANIQATTPIPAADDPANWRQCAKGIDLVGSDYAHLRLTKELAKVNTLSLQTGSKASDLNLDGKTLVVNKVYLNDENSRIAPGTYTYADAQERGWTWLKDSSFIPAVADNPETEEDESAPAVPGTGILRIATSSLIFILQ